MPPDRIALRGHLFNNLITKIKPASSSLVLNLLVQILKTRF